MLTNWSYHSLARCRWHCFCSSLATDFQSWYPSRLMCLLYPLFSLICLSHLVTKPQNSSKTRRTQWLQIPWFIPALGHHQLHISQLQLQPEEKSHTNINDSPESQCHPIDMKIELGLLHCLLYIYIYIIYIYIYIGIVKNVSFFRCSAAANYFAAKILYPQLIFAAALLNFAAILLST